MAVYGVFAKSLLESNVEELYNNSFIMVESLANLYISESIIGEDYSESFNIDSLFNEGATMDYVKIFRDGKKKYKEAMKSCNKAIKENRYSDAKNQIKVAKNILNQMKKDINKIEPTIGSNAISNIFNSVLSLADIIVPTGIAYGGWALASNGIAASAKTAGAGLIRASIGGFAAGYFGTTAMLKLMINILNSTVQFKEDLDNKDISNAKTFNGYRNRILVIIGQMDTQLSNLENTITKKEKSKI